MGRIRKVAAIAVLCVVAAGYGTVSPAQAETLKTETLAGLAESAGLTLKLGATSLTLGSATSSVNATLANTNKTLAAVAKGAGQLLSASEVATKAPKLDGLLSDVGQRACAIPEIPLAGILNISAACGNSASSVVNDLPTSSAIGYVADIRVPGNGLVGQLLAGLGIDNLGATLDGLLGGGTPLSGVSGAQATDQGLLGGLLGTLDGLGLSSGNGAVGSVVPQLSAVDQVLQSVLDVLNGGVGLNELIPDPVVVTVGNSTSSVVTELGKVTSEAVSSGVDIKVLPLANVAGLIPNLGVVNLSDGLLRIVIGEAKTTAVLDRVTGKSTANVGAANLLRLSVLGINVPISPNFQLDLPGLLSLTLGKGTTEILSDRAGATAVGAALKLLPSANGSSLLELRLADAESRVGGALKLTDVPQVLNRVEQPRELPRTGANGPLLALLGGGVLALAVVSRRAILRTR
jgi:hypothetical protein